MWYQSLKTRQTIKRLNTRNSCGIAVALEYLDEKIEVHHLKKEATPLVFEEGTCVVFVTPKGGGLTLVAVNTSPKGKSTYEFRCWDLNSASAFVVQNIQVQDIHKSFTNDGKSRALLSLPDANQTRNQYTKADALADVMAIGMDVGIYIWNTVKINNGGISCTIAGYVCSSMLMFDLLLLQPSKVSFPQLLVGESGGIRVWEKNNDSDCRPVSTFKDTFYYVPSVESAPTSALCQDFHRIYHGACIFSSNVGNLYMFISSHFISLTLPISFGGHEVYSVEDEGEMCSKVTLAVVSKGHTINLYHLEDITNLPNSCKQLNLTPYHALLSSQPISAVSFPSKGCLVTCSSSGRTLSLWAGV